jgi:hypothetical protein
VKIGYGSGNYQSLLALASVRTRGIGAGARLCVNIRCCHMLSNGLKTFRSAFLILIFRRVVILALVLGHRVLWLVSSMINGVVLKRNVL